MRFVFKFFEIPRIWKRVITLSCDVMFIVSSYFLAFVIRIGEQDISLWITNDHILVVGITCMVSIFVWIRLGLYRSVIRYIDVKALSNLTLGSLVSAVTLLVSSYVLNANMPRSIPFIYFTLILILTAGSRLFIRGLIHSQHNSAREKVIIYGAGSSGRQLCLSLIHGKEYTPVAFVDCDQHIQNTTVADVKIYGPEKIAKLVEEYNVHKILLAIPSATEQQKKNIIKSVESLKVRILTIPGSADLVSGKVSVTHLRDIGIKDLLGRDAVPPENRLLEKCIREKCVMVTGGGGSIGSELCRQIIKLEPKTLIIFETSEYNLYAIESELAELNVDVEVVPILGSVLDKNLIEEAITEFSIETIYHAAAYKHVPLVEMNVEQGIKNNITGTKIVAELAAKYSVSHFVLISTDKAVRPTNVMGATKRTAELIVQDFASQDTKTIFCMVRFGNVLGSSGSVVPRFKKQISEGGPVTVTHPEITRYFMTIPEAASLVIQAGAMAKGGEVFVLDMGQPVKIRDLAENMINLMGLRVRSDTNPGGDIEIQYTGLRPGEKLYEELLIGSNVEGTSHARIMKAKELCLTKKELEIFLDSIQSSIQNKDMASLREVLMTGKLGYSPVSEINDVLYKRKGRNELLKNKDKNVCTLKSEQRG